MKFTIDRELLQSTLQNVARGLSTKTPMPVLMGIQIQASKEQLIFITTNKEISIKIDLYTNDLVQVEEEGSCVVPGKYFVEIIKKLEGKIIEFTLFEETTIKIISDRSDFTLIAYDKNNFPVHNFEFDCEPIRFSSGELKQIIRQTTFATATSETRIVLTSVNFKIEDANLCITATDSFRLAKKQTVLTTDVANLQVNIPGKALEEFGKIIEDQNDQILLYILNNKALFKYKNVSFMTRLVEGSYPDTSSLFPKEYLLNIKFNKNEIVSAVDRAALFANSDNLSIVKLTLNPDKSVEISSNSTEIGKVVEEIYPISISDMMNFQIAFSTKYLIDALKSFDSKEISIHFTGEIKPAVIQSENDANLVQLLLPVRVF